MKNILALLKLFIVFSVFTANSQSIRINLDVPDTNLIFQIIENNENEVQYYFHGEDSSKGRIWGGVDSGEKRAIYSVKSTTFERKIVAQRTDFPTSSKLMYIHRDEIFYVKRKAAGSVIEKLNIRTGISTTASKILNGSPLSLKVDTDGKTIYFMIVDGIYSIATNDINNFYLTKSDQHYEGGNWARAKIHTNSNSSHIVVTNKAMMDIYKIENYKITPIRRVDFIIDNLGEYPKDLWASNEEHNKADRYQITAASFIDDKHFVYSNAYGETFVRDIISNKYWKINNKGNEIFNEIKIAGKYLFLLNYNFGTIFFINKTDTLNARVMSTLIKLEGDFLYSNKAGKKYYITSVSEIDNKYFNFITNNHEILKVACCEQVYTILRDRVWADNRRLMISKDGFFNIENFSAFDLANINIKIENFSGGLLEIYDIFFRPDIVADIIKDIDLIKYSKSGSMLASHFLNNLSPVVSNIYQAEVSANQRRAKFIYEIGGRNGGIAEVRIFHNGKLISSDGTYKDAPGKAYAPVGGKNADANQYVDAQRSIRNAGLLEPANSATANQGGSLSSQLIVRGAPEKKCNPCKGEIEIDVIPGEENTVSVVAFNRDNTIQSVPASVTFKSTLPKEEPHLWLLSVGINQFQGITPLVNAKKDALDFACTYAGKAALTKLGLICSEAGRAQSLFKPQNIHVVDALLDAKATKANIQSALDKIASQAKPGDTFVWFVASHGMMDANSLFGIVAHDTKCLNDKCTDISGHITSNEILEASKKIKAMKQLMVLDTCHSGGLDSKMSGLYDARMSLLAKNMGLHMYASAQATEQAQDGVPGSNGTFTAQLLEGIKGAAPKNSDGFISIMTLGQYAKQKTIEATQAKGGANTGKAVQTPVIQHFGLDASLVGVGAR